MLSMRLSFSCETHVRDLVRAISRLSSCCLRLNMCSSVASVVQLVKIKVMP